MFSQFFNPEGQRILRISGRYNVSEKDLKNQPLFSSEISKIEEFIGTRKLISLRSEFDKTYLNSEFKRAGKSLLSQFVDLIKIIEKNEPRLAGKSLSQLCKAVGIEKNSQYETEDDLVATYRLFINFNCHKYLT